MPIIAGAVSAGVTLGKLLADVAEAIARKKDPDLLAKFLELQVQLSHVIQDNVELRDKIRELRDRSKAREGLKFEDNVWWATAANGSRDGPYCPVCLAKDERRQPMALENKIWGCQVCHCQVATPERRAEFEEYLRHGESQGRWGDAMGRR